MATNKPKIQGYIEKDTFDRFEVFRIEQGLSQSQALEVVIAGFFNLERSQQPESINTKLADLEESIESLNKLCKHSFKQAFGRIGKLERITSNLLSDTPEITSDLPSDLSSDTPEITSDLPSDTPSIQGDLPSNPLVICKLYKNNASDPQHWRFWAGDKQGFVDQLAVARTYKSEASVKRQLTLIEKSDHAPTTREFLSYRAFEEIKEVVDNLQADTAIASPANSSV